MYAVEINTASSCICAFDIVFSQLKKKINIPFTVVSIRLYESNYFNMRPRKIYDITHYWSVVSLNVQSSNVVNIEMKKKIENISKNIVFLNYTYKSY